MLPVSFDAGRRRLKAHPGIHSFAAELELRRASLGGLLSAAPGAKMPFGGGHRASLAGLAFGLPLVRPSLWRALDRGRCHPSRRRHPFARRPAPLPSSRSPLRSEPRATKGRNSSRNRGMPTAWARPIYPSEVPEQTGRARRRLKREGLAPPRLRLTPESAGPAAPRGGCLPPGKRGLHPVPESGQLRRPVPRRFRGPLRSARFPSRNSSSILRTVPRVQAGPSPDRHSPITIEPGRGNSVAGRLS